MEIGRGLLGARVKRCLPPLGLPILPEPVALPLPTRAAADARRPALPLLALWQLVVYSAPAHKEFRFLLPALQLLAPCAGLALSRLHSSGGGGCSSGDRIMRGLSPSGSSVELGLGPQQQQSLQSQQQTQHADFDGSNGTNGSNGGGASAKALRARNVPPLSSRFRAGQQQQQAPGRAVSPTPGGSPPGTAAQLLAARKLCHWLLTMLLLGAQLPLAVYLCRVHQR